MNPVALILAAYAVALAALAVVLAIVAMRSSRGRARRPRACRVCGCTEFEACWPSGCWWVAEDLCSACDPSDGTYSRLDRSDGLDSRRSSLEEDR